MKVFFTSKPYGWPTHQVDRGKPGFVEYLESKIMQKLFVAHRLDKTTTGAMVFAKDLDTAKALQTAFSEHQVKKEYLFVTDRDSKQKNISVESFLEEKDKKIFSSQDKPANAFTDFTWLKTFGNFHLWSAIPKSGKTHQIRVHAKEVGLPILGDPIYGGSEYPFLLLHSKSLYISEDLQFSAPIPKYLDDISLLENINFARAIRAIDDRFFLFNTAPSCLRWLHKEIPWLCVDQLGTHVWYQIFEAQSHINELVSSIHSYLETTQKIKLSRHVQVMPNRGEAPNKKLVTDYGETRWVSEEHGIRYEFRSDSGSSYGLFLDQRQNRRWMLENAKDKRVLNLFCYTGGFSLCALKAGAKEVISVDTSKATLEWLQTNVVLNDFELGLHKSWATDARIFLKGSLNRQQEFDLIVCDPPSFSRGKEGTFRIENDFKELLKACLLVLAKKGTLLFSTNFEGWQEADFKEYVEENLPKGFNLERFTSSDVDYEAPNQNRILKAVFISRL
jgi:23S rRNA (cytosine1962-C5)-methyltransferase